MGKVMLSVTNFAAESRFTIPAAAAGLLLGLGLPAVTRANCRTL